MKWWFAVGDDGGHVVLPACSGDSKADPTAVDAERVADGVRCLGTCAESTNREELTGGALEVAVSQSARAAVYDPDIAASRSAWMRSSRGQAASGGMLASPAQ